LGRLLDKNLVDDLQVIFNEDGAAALREATARARRRQVCSRSVKGIFTTANRVFILHHQKEHHPLPQDHADR
jgi:hypothetical protein